MADISYLQALVVGAFQGVSELFPISSLGHSILLPALVGGSWKTTLDVAAPDSPYLAFLVALHVATAAALLVHYRRDWVAVVSGLVTSVRDRRVVRDNERLAWMLVAATVPVGLAGLALDHLFRTTLGRPVPAALFLILNGAVLYGGERLRHTRPHAAAATASHAASGISGDRPDVANHAPGVPVGAAAERQRPRWVTLPAATAPTTGMQAHGRRWRPQLSSPALAAASNTMAEQASLAPRIGAAAHDALTRDDRALSRLGLRRAVLIGSAQILALLPGISRSGVTMVAGLARGLTHEQAVRFSFLLATPVILAAGLFKAPDLLAPSAATIHGQVLAGSAAAFGSALLAVRFLERWFQARTLTPFAVYSVLLGAGSLAWLTLH